MSKLAILKASVISFLVCASTLASAADKADFSETDFPPEVYGGLSGSIHYYDVSGGVNTEARSSTIFQRFKDLTGVEILSDYSADFTKFFASMQAGVPSPWSIVELATLGEYERAKKLGYLEEIDPAIVPLSNLPEGTGDKYGIKAGVFSANLIWNTDKWPVSGTHPSAWSDLFDTRKFPGKRCLFSYPEYGATLEAALLADGVPAEKLYPLDVNRALNKLDTIKEDIVWWSSGAQSTQYFTTGECDLGIVWNSRIAAAVNDENAPLALSWDQAIYVSSMWAIPKGAPNLNAAQALLAFWVSDREGQIQYVTKFPIPTPLKTVGLQDYPQSVRPFLPDGDNLKTAIEENADYYEANLPSIVEQFNAWRGK